ncbi:unnamed protein product [Prunus brigantina]
MPHKLMITAIPGIILFLSSGDFGGPERFDCAISKHRVKNGAFCLDSDPSWEAMVLLLVFFLGGIGEDSSLIPSKVSNICRGFFIPAAIDELRLL